MSDTPESVSASRSSSRRSWRDWLLWPVYVAIEVCLLAGLLVRLTVRDSLQFASTVFYATPLPLLTVAAAILLLIDWKRQRWLRGMAWGILLGVLGTWTAQQNWRWGSGGPPGDSGETLQVVFWNCARRDDLTPVVNYLRQTNADVIGLAEVVGPVEERRNFFRQELPDYDVSTLGASMYLFVRGDSGQSTPKRLDLGSHARSIPVTIRGVEFTCVIVDIGPYLVRMRETPLLNLTEFLKEVSGERVVLMGDFNTPIDSNHFEPLRKTFRLAYEVAGQGWGPTWPVPVPVLHLDQLWVNSGRNVLDCRHGFSLSSDHRPVHAVLQP